MSDVQGRDTWKDTLTSASERAEYMDSKEAQKQADRERYMQGTGKIRDSLNVPARPSALNDAPVEQDAIMSGLYESRDRLRGKMETLTVENERILTLIQDTSRALRIVEEAINTGMELSPKTTAVTGAGGSGGRHR